MEWLLSNWIWIVFGVAMIAMHMFGHGGHGHGAHSKDNRRDSSSAKETTAAPPTEHAHADDTVLTATDANDRAPHDAPAHGGHGASPIPKDGERHLHGC